jgi:ribose transport system substrate-binding protein
MKKHLSVVLVVVLALLLLYGCAAPGQAPTTSTDQGGTSTAPAAPSASTEDTAKSGFKIAVSTGMAGNTWVPQYVTGLEDRFKEYKADGTIADYQIATTNADLTEQINQCTSMINSGIDCLILWPASTTGVQPIIELAKQNDVLVIIDNDPAAYEGTYCVCGVGAKWMEILTNWIVTELGGKGNIVRIAGMAGNNSNELREAAADAILAKYPDIHVLASGNGNYSQTVAQDLMTTYLSTYGDQIDAVLAEDVMGDGILKAYENAGMTPKIMTGDYLKSFLVGWSEVPGLKCCTDTFDAHIGVTALDVAVNLLKGKTFKDGILKPNPADESLVNALVVDPAYVVTNEGDQNAPWMEGLTSKAITLQDALDLVKDKDDTYALDGGMTTDEVAALFN